MPEAVIVDAIRTPIGRAMKGTLRDVRADDLAAIPLRALVDRNPGVEFGETNDILMGCGFPDGEQGYNIGRNARVAGGDRSSRPGGHGQPLLRVVVADDPDGLSCHQGRRGRSVHRAGVECVSRGAAQTFPLMNPHIDGTNGTGYNVYISMGITAENVAERCHVSRESQDEWAAIPSSARWPPARAATSTARSSASRSPSCMTPAATSSPRTPSRATTGRAPAPPSRSSPR